MSQTMTFFHGPLRKCFPERKRGAHRHNRSVFSRLFIFIHLFLCLSIFGQETISPEIRDLATETVADVLFDSQARVQRQQMKAFEQAHGVKLLFTVDDASIDQLGGLSEHLFKLYKTLVTPGLSQSKTITGEFSLVDNNVLSDLLSYRTNATPDLRACALPQAETNVFDSLSNKLYSTWSLATEDMNAAPQNLNQSFSDARGTYADIIRTHSECAGMAMAEYDLCVKNTRGSRSSDWSGDALVIANALFSSHDKLTHTVTGSYNSGNTGISGGYAPELGEGRHIVDLASAITACPQRDMEHSAAELFRQTGIRLLFVTKTLNYFVPRDSLELFRNIATTTFSNNLTDDLIFALYLRMSDNLSGKQSGVLLVKQQNGEWLSSADINYANYNNHGDYFKSGHSKFYNLYRNIPKPVIVCYQLAKVNGVFTTMNLKKGTNIKGLAAIYNHVFVCDNAFGELASVQQRIDALESMVQTQGSQLMGMGSGAGSSQIYGQVGEELLKQKTILLRALFNPQMETADFQVRELYLKDRPVVEAAALRYLKSMYGDLYAGNRIDQLTAETAIPADVMAGSCLIAEEVDVVGDILDVSSLLLAPTGFDIIPDALSVLYYAGTGKLTKSLSAAGSLLLVGSVNGAALVAGDVMLAAKKGNFISKQGNTYKEVPAGPQVLTTMFRLDQVSPGLAKKMVDNPAITDLLIGKRQESFLTLDAKLQSIYLNVEALPPTKRHEFLEKCFDDEVFRGKVLDDADEVLVWGGVIIRPKNVSEIKHLLKTENGSAFFWSGKTDGVGGASRAFEIAQTRAGETLEGVLAAKGIELPTWDVNNAEVVKLWEDVSSEYARGAKGEVRAVIGKQLRPGNIWQSKEIDILKSNLSVTRIVQIDPLTLEETVIFAR